MKKTERPDDTSRFHSDFNLQIEGSSDFQRGECIGFMKAVTYLASVASDKELLDEMLRYYEEEILKK